MDIQKDRLVQFEYQLRSDSGELLDSSDLQGPLEYLHGHGDILLGLEEALTGATDGQKIAVRLSPEKAYGPVYDELVQRVPSSVFDDVESIEPGMQFEATVQNGQVRKVLIKEVTADNVVVDGNHHLAGQWLNFDIEVTMVRPVSEQELKTRG